MEQQVTTQQPPAAPVVPMTAEPDIASILSPQAPAQEQPTVPETPPAAAAQVPASEPAPAPQPHMVPLPELLEQRHAKQIAELKAQQAEARLAEIQRALEAQQRAMQPPPQPIDPIADPEGFARHVLTQNAELKAQMQEQALHQRANMSEMLARREHGTEKVDEAIQAAVQAGLNRNFMQQPDPYKALMDWHGARTIAQQVGPDLKAWEARKEAEIEARVLAKLSGKPPPQTAAAASPNLPPSLATATKANTAAPVVESANDFFNSMFRKAR